MRAHQDREAGSPKRHQAPAGVVARDGEVLRLQRLAGNTAVSSLLGKRPAQRVLDEGFKHGGTPTPDELAACQAFARKVSGFVDEAHRQLLAGDVAGWQGEKINTFVNLLQQGKSVALAWAGNAIEERVYTLMRGTDMILTWVPQFAEGMGGASLPDIVITLSDSPLKQALIDVTSDRYHILGKAGGWTTSQRYVYVAEAWFPSVQAQHVPTILAGLKAGGLDAAEVEKRIKEADAERARAIEARTAELRAARDEYNGYVTFARLIKGKFKGDRKAALAWVRANGLGQVKGVPKVKGKRKPSLETKTMMKRRAAKARELAKAEALAGARSHDDGPSARASSLPDSDVLSDSDVMDQEAFTDSEDEFEDAEALE
ncbi:hypothetical protein AB0F52_38665 [Amycolatopsis sp. NPDC024027]|uniref:hypothetical protein n=1 Tax=Amycolatopsis sp. NPDC024027 TaxID=3154327 RepID=UPI0033FA749F